MVDHKQSNLFLEYKQWVILPFLKTHNFVGKYNISASSARQQRWLCLYNATYDLINDVINGVISNFTNLINGVVNDII